MLLEILVDHEQCTYIQNKEGESFMTDSVNKNNHPNDDSLVVYQTDSDLDDRDYRLAGFWMRFWAFLADTIIVFSINGIILSPLQFINEGSGITISAWTLKGILGGIVFYLYFLIMTKKLGQTVGKMIFGLKVIRSDQKPLQWSDLIFREVVVRFCYKAFSFLNLLYLIIAFNREKQGLHDMVGNTKVIHVD